MLAAERRVLVTVDSDSGKACSVPVHITTSRDELAAMSPCIVPSWEDINEVIITWLMTIFSYKVMLSLLLSVHIKIIASYLLSRDNWREHCVLKVAVLPQSCFKKLCSLLNAFLHAITVNLCKVVFVHVCTYMCMFVLVYLFRYSIID